MVGTALQATARSPVGLVESWRTLHAPCLGDGPRGPGSASKQAVKIPSGLQGQVVVTLAQGQDYRAKAIAPAELRARSSLPNSPGDY